MTFILKMVSRNERTGPFRARSLVSSCATPPWGWDDLARNVREPKYPGGNPGPSGLRFARFGLAKHAPHFWRSSSDWRPFPLPWQTPLRCPHRKARIARHHPRSLGWRSESALTHRFRSGLLLFGPSMLLPPCYARTDSTLPRLAGSSFFLSPGVVPVLDYRPKRNLSLLVSLPFRYTIASPLC